MTVRTRSFTLLALALTTLASTRAAWAEAPADAPAGEGARTAPEAEDEPDFGHFGQLGLRVGLVGGYRMIFRYDESPFCTEPDPSKGEDQQQFCGNAAPLAADFGLSFALLDFLEPFAWARFGFTGEDSTDTEPLVVLGVGTRLYMTADSRLKFFIQPALGWELERGRGTAIYEQVDRQLGSQIEYKRDLLFHVLAGPQFDFSENFGAYAGAGMTVGVIRAIHATLELQAGIQGRVF